MPKASYEKGEDYKSSSPGLGKVGSATGNTGVHFARTRASANESRLRALQTHDNPSQKTFSPRNGRSGQSTLLRGLPAQELELTESAAGRINIQQDQPDNPVF